MADTTAIPDNLEELIASHTKLEGGPHVPENAWLEVQFPSPGDNGATFNLLQIPQQGTLGLFAEANNLRHLYYWRQGGETQALALGHEYSLSVHPGEAIVWEFAEGNQTDFKMAWWFE